MDVERITEPDDIRALIESARAEAAAEFMSIAREWGLSVEDAEWAWRIAWSHGRSFGELSFYATAIEEDVETALAAFQVECEAELAVAEADR